MEMFHHNLPHKVIQEHQELPLVVAVVVEQVQLAVVELVVTVYQHFLLILVFHHLMEHQIQELLVDGLLVVVVEHATQVMVELVVVVMVLNPERQTLAEVVEELQTQELVGQAVLVSSY